MGLKSDGWTVAPIERWEGEHFCRLWHYSKSAPNTATYCHGLIDPEWVHRGAAIWIPPTKNAAATVAGDRWREVLCLSRLVVDPEAPKMSASFLLGRSMRLIDRARWPWLLTYADTALGHTGAIYLATNWQRVGEVPAGDTWVHAVTGEQRGRKRGGRTLLAEQMRALGFERRPASAEGQVRPRGRGGVMFSDRSKEDAQLPQRLESIAVEWYGTSGSIVRDLHRAAYLLRELTEEVDTLTEELHGVEASAAETAAELKGLRTGLRELLNLAVSRATIRGQR